MKCMKKMLFVVVLLGVLFLLFGCSSTPKVGDTIPKEDLNAVFGGGALQFRYRWSIEFFQEWFVTTSEWPTQADVDAWEKARGLGTSGE